jgi:hypothetical protein
MSETYVDQVLEGSALWTDIDDFVDEWHESGPEVPLHEYLGFSWDDYRLWVEQPRSLRMILAAHKYHEPVGALAERSGDLEALAARGLSPEDTQIVRAWLHQTGRLPSR